MPKATVAAIVTAMYSDPIKILLTRRNIEPFKGYWCLPGGHIGPYEPARDAVIREVKEETGLDFEAEFFGYFDEVFPDLSFHAVVMAFEGPGMGKLNIQEDEVSVVKWFTVEEARSLSLAFTHNKILDTYTNQSK